MDDGSLGANPWLFSDGEGPSGLASYDPNGSAPPTDWRTGNYHPLNTFVEQRRENVRSDLTGRAFLVTSTARRSASISGT